MKSNYRKVIYIAIVLLFMLQPAFSEIKSYSNDELGYNVITEVNYVGKNLSDKEIEEYDSVLFNWCNEIGNNAKRIGKLSKEVDWGFNHALSKYDLKEGEIYFIRIAPISEEMKTKASYIIILCSILDNGNFKIVDMIESCIEIEAEEQAEVSEIDGSTLYENKLLGYKGSVNLQYMGKYTEEDLNALVEEIYKFVNSGGYIATQVQKLTKEQDWLLQKSLSSYKLEKGETYSANICIVPKSFPAYFSAMIVVLTVTDIDEKTGDYQYRFYAYDVKALNE